MWDITQKVTNTQATNKFNRHSQQHDWEEGGARREEGGTRLKRAKGVKHPVTGKDESLSGEHQHNIQTMYRRIIHLKLI